MSSHSAATLYLAGMLGVGVWIGVYLKPGLTLCLCLTAGLLFLFSLSVKGILKPAYWVLAGITILGIGMLSMASTLPENLENHYLNQIHPKVRSLEIQILETLKPGRFSERYTGEIRQVNSFRAEGKVLVELRKDSSNTPLLPGQRLLTPVLPQTLTQPANPGEFDYGAYLKSQGIYGRLKLSAGTYLLTRTSPHTTARSFKGVREKMARSLETLRAGLNRALEDIGLGRDETRIARALLLGDRTDVDSDLNTAYKKAGVMHLLAISGLHVGVFATFLFAILAPLKHLRYGKGLRAILGLMILWGYALLAGFSPSVVRAVLLFSFVALSLYLERPGQTLHFLGLCWILMLVSINPNWLLQIGFQLSFAAVAAIVVYYPFLFRKLSSKSSLWNYFGKLIAVSLAAQAGTLPFTLYYFNQFPGLFLLSNLVLLPPLGVLLVTGLACLSLELLFSLPQALSSLLDGLLRMMNNYVQWASGQEAFFFENISMTWAEFMLSTLAIVLFGVYLKVRHRKILFGVAGILLLFQSLGIYNKIQNSRTDIYVIPHQIANTMVWMRKGSHLQVSCADSLKSAYLVGGVQKQWGIRSTNYIPLASEYNLEGVSLRVLDSSGLYSPDESRPDFLLLSGSPHVHLGRVLQDLKPAVVIADGSNYSSDLKRWKRSCSEKGIPFHTTAQWGAYQITIPLKLPRKKPWKPSGKMRGEFSNAHYP